MVEPTKLDKHRTGDKVTFRCAAGYILSGYKSITCRYVPHYNKMSWDNTQPTCIGQFTSIQLTLIKIFFKSYIQSVNVIDVHVHLRYQFRRHCKYYEWTMSKCQNNQTSVPIASYSYQISNTLTGINTWMEEHSRSHHIKRRHFNMTSFVISYQGQWCTQKTLRKK